MNHELRDLRRRIEALATPDGTFGLACARTGERPVPAADLRFADRPTAERAGRLVSEYRERLREWDPRTPRYDVAVHQRGPDGDGVSRLRRAVRASEPRSAPARGDATRDSLGASPGDVQ